MTVSPPLTSRIPSWINPSRLMPRDVLSVVFIVVLGILVLAALFAPWLTPYPADANGATHPLQSLHAPSAQHWFGTDGVGRDILTRVVFGARTSLIVVIAVLLFSIVFGTLTGVIAGYAGGVVRDVIMRITDIFLAFPALLLALALALVLPRGIPTLIICVAITWWPWYTRLAASVAASISRRGYVDSARTLGVSAQRIVLRHVLPNSLTPVIVQASLDAGGIILVVATLSYLGLGVSEPTPEWGLMVQQGQALITTNWWVVTFPALAILITAFSFNMLGEGLRVSLDPKKAGR
ncbi:ABC transporter permease [Cryobacterium tagatosivorans]|uniref:ABC transporter permease n=1 Tax=Cryobacterium tagatosivorans TaxID=1259199 RepID=A0A4R8UHP7_9MICO|nr:ABC transporter permease [Cryobacterium tagatosivorans]TFB56375.1 ABC transporter permease [Cryobacterium tagatosivorans]